MSCPLSALANIAAMTASSSSAMPNLNDSLHSMLSAVGSVASGGGSASASPSSSPSPSVSSTSAMANKPMKKRPMKKRSVPADFAVKQESECVNYSNYDSVAADHYQLYNMPVAVRSSSLGNKRSNKKAKTSCHTHSEPSRKQRSASYSSYTTSTDEQFEMKTGQPAFPVILMAIMSAPQNKDYITFLSDKQSFIIVHPEALAKNVLPIHFEGNVPSFDQFLALLFKWGFENIADSQYPQVVVYKHPNFLKGDWEACLDMKLPGNGDNNMATNNTNKSRRTPSPAVSLGRDSPKMSPRANDHPQYQPQLPPSPRQDCCTPTHARSVTPPEVHLASSTSPELLFQSQAATSQWMKQSAALEAMIMATAETRRRLSGYRGLTIESIAACPSLEEVTALNHTQVQSTMYHQQQRQRSYSSVDSNAAAASLMMPTSTLGRSVSAGLSDAQVNMVTQDVVSAAVAALHRTKHRQQQQQQSQYSPEVISPSSSTSRLDAMTEVFLERSNARRLKSRPIGIFGSSNSATMAQLSEVVDARTRVYYLGQGVQQ